MPCSTGIYPVYLALNYFSTVWGAARSVTCPMGASDFPAGVNVKRGVCTGRTRRHRYTCRPPPLPRQSQSKWFDNELAPVWPRPTPRRGERDLHSSASFHLNVCPEQRGARWPGGSARLRPAPAQRRLHNFLPGATRRCPELSCRRRAAPPDVVQASSPAKVVH